MVAKNTLYCLISSRIFKTRLILSKQLSLLFGNFEVITIEPFDIHTSSRYLDQHTFELKLRPELKDFIINFTGGYPLYLELITDALSKRPVSFSPAIPTGKHTGGVEVNLADTLEDLLFNTSGILNQRFSNYIKRFLDLGASNDYVSIFYLIASGRNRIKDIAHILHKQKKDLMVRTGRG
jgi:hypothetical protein